jgi:predicted transposase YdaD
MKESVFYQMVLEEGEAKGEKRWKVEEARRILLQMGERRFGPPNPALVATIEATDSIDRLEKWLFRLFDVSSWEELLAEPQAGE